MSSIKRTFIRGTQWINRLAAIPVLGSIPTLRNGAGDSMGGYFTICMLLKLRDIGQPLPAAAVCISPNTDPTLSGKSMKTNAKKDALLSPKFARRMMSLYVSGHNLNDSYLSPLTADLRGLPPILIQTGADEIL